MNKMFTLIAFVFLFWNCQNEANQKDAYVPESSGKLNHVNVVMPEKDWNSNLGNSVRETLQQIYEGLPIDEPQFSVNYLNPKTFTGFARQGRNVVWFQKDSTARFQLAQNQFARPQILAQITGEDTEIQQFYFEENASLLIRSFNENERKEKLRRISKSLTTEKTLLNRFGVEMDYPSAYETVKDTTNFVWIQKPVQKGHLNIIAYTLGQSALEGKYSERILDIRDSIGKLFVPGRLKGSYFITERAFLPYFYKTELDQKKAFLTKGTWEVANDFMAGPFVNYAVQDTIRKRWIVVEGFAFAPSANKREYMFELNTILSTLKHKEN
ncbi:DUF4837 family protein [Flavobacteriaceae bacterium]|jgi:hypothetical protein|nr:DUF4837 family protein [Flavobacteriaceae bacterium]